MSLESDGRESDGLETCSREKDVAPLEFVTLRTPCLNQEPVATTVANV